MSRVRRLIGMATAVVVGAVAVVAVGQDDGRPAAAQSLAAASVASGQLQFDSGGPVRVFDSRDGTGVAAGAPGMPGPLSPDAPGSARMIFTPGAPREAIAALVNITVVVTDPAAFGYAAARADTRRGTSTVNWSGPGTFANFAFVPLDHIPNPFFTLIIEGNRAVHVIVDLEGWVMPAA